MLRKKAVQHVWLIVMGTDTINLHCKNEMIHFSNKIVVIVITCRLLDIFVIHLGLSLSVQQWTTELQTGQREIQLPLELLFISITQLVDFNANPAF